MKGFLWQSDTPSNQIQYDAFFANHAVAVQVAGVLGLKLDRQHQSLNADDHLS